MDRFTPRAASGGIKSAGLGGVTSEVGRLMGNALGSGDFLSSWKRDQQDKWKTPTQAPRFASSGAGATASRGFGSTIFDKRTLAPDVPETAAPGGAGQGGSLVNSGQFDDVNPLLTQIGNKWGVPPAVLKAVIKRESSGDWAYNGGRFPQIRSGAGGYILPYVGIFANAWSSWGCPGQASQAVGDQAAQVDCLARGLSRFYNNSPSKTWESVAAMHFSGQWDPNSGWRDENGMSVAQYTNSFMNDVNTYGGVGGPLPGGQGATGGPAGPSGGLAMVWGNVGNPNLDYGYNAPSSLGLYNYGRNYGMNGVNHTGIDIPQTLNSPVYTPVAGTVVCACTGSGGGCAAFSDVMGDGCGRVEVALDNGDRIIFGHTSRALVRLGDRVNVGQQIATVGGMNGSHTHLEYRIPDAGQPAGYRIVDPAQHLGGGGGGRAAQGGMMPGTGAPTGGAPAPRPWERRTATMRQTYRPRVINPWER